MWLGSAGLDSFSNAVRPGWDKHPIISSRTTHLTNQTHVKLRYLNARVQTATPGSVRIMDTCTCVSHETWWKYDWQLSCETHLFAFKDLFKLPFDPLDRDVGHAVHYTHQHAHTHAHTSTHAHTRTHMRTHAPLALSVQYGTVFGHMLWYQCYLLIISTFCTTFRWQHCINALRTYCIMFSQFA